MSFTTQLSRFVFRNHSYFPGYLLNSRILRRGNNFLTSSTPSRSYFFDSHPHSRSDSDQFKFHHYSDPSVYFHLFGSAQARNLYPLHYAAFTGQVDAVVSLSKNISINSIDANNNTPLSLAIFAGHYDTVVELLKMKAQVNVSKKARIDSLLHLACRLDNYEIVRALLVCGANIHCENESGQTPLSYAVHRGNVRFARELLRRGSNPNSRYARKNTVLHQAVYARNYELVELLLNYNADVNAIGEGDASPLSIAITFYNGRLVKLLLKAGADVNYSINDETLLAKAIQHNTAEVVQAVLQYLNPRSVSLGVYFGHINAFVRPLVYSSRFSSASVVSELLQRLPTYVDLKESIYVAMEGGRVNVMQLLLDREKSLKGKYSIEFNKYDNRFGLHQAARRGLNHVIHELLRRGADANSKDPEGVQTIHLAAVSRNNELIKILIQYGASVNTPAGLGDPIQPGHTPLFYAAVSSNLDTLRLLLDNGADLNAVDSEGSTLLHIASAYGASEIVKFLLYRGFPLEQVNNGNLTPLLCACLSGNIELVLYLLKHGANIHHRTKKQESCLHLAVSHYHIVLELLNRGIFVDSVKEGKESPLHLALREGNWRVSRLLIERGANIALENAKGKTPLEVVHPMIAQDLFFYLKENGFVKDADKDHLPVNQNHNKTLLSAFLASVLVFTAVLTKK